MKKKFNHDWFWKTLNHKKHQKKIKLEVEGKKTTSGKYVLIPKEMIISKELFQELGFQERIIDPKGVTVARAKQKSVRDLLVSFMAEQMKFNNDQKKFNKKLDKRLAALEQLPTIKKELDQVKEQDS